MALALLVLACQATSSPAAAVTDEERAGAREAATEGSHAFEEGRFADAIDLFTRAESLVHSPVHLLYIARSQAQLGSLVKARETYLKILGERVGPDAPPAFSAAVESATSESQTIDGRIPRISVSVDGQGAGDASVKIDGKTVPKALVGVPRPVDPGKHSLQAFAPGMQSDLVETTLAEGDRKSIVLVLKPSPENAAAAPAGTQTPPTVPARPIEPAPTSAGVDVSPEDVSATNGLRVGSYIAFGVGAIGLGAGAYFGLNANSKADDRDKLYDSCEPNCSSTQQKEILNLNDDATSASTISTVGWVVGGVGVATGVTLLVLSLTEHESPSEAGTRIRPWVGLQSAGVTGAF